MAKYQWAKNRDELRQAFKRVFAVYCGKRLASPEQIAVDIVALQNMLGGVQNEILEEQ